MSLENSFLPVRSCSEFHERYDDRVSVFDSNKQNNDTESVISLNENQFSLPLQQNLERTSTPVQIYSEPISFTQNQINSDENSRISVNQLKSVSANSNTVKWGIEKTQNIVSTPSSPSALKINEQSSQSQLNVPSKTQLNSTKSKGIKWGIEESQKINLIPSKSNKLSGSFHNITAGMSTSNNEKSVSNILQLPYENHKQINNAISTNSRISCNDSSIPSVNNEHQFSLPLQQNLERTSTPLQKYSEPIPLMQNQTKRNLNNQINLNENSRISEDQLKSTSANSNTVKWGIEETQNIVSTPSSSSVLKTNEIPKARMFTKLKTSELSDSNLQKRESVQHADSDSTKYGRSNKQHLNSTNTIQWSKARSQTMNLTSSQSNELSDSFRNITLSTSTSKNRKLQLINKQADCIDSKQTKHAISTNSMINYHDSSIRSVNNEHQFSLPLQQDSKKTSTPLKINSKILSEPISYIQKQTPVRNSNKHANSEVLRSKTTSANSDSIKWKIGKTQQKILVNSTSPFISETNQQTHLDSVFWRHRIYQKNFSIRSAPEIINQHQSKIPSKNAIGIDKGASKQKNVITSLLENNKKAKSSDSTNLKKSSWDTKKKTDKNANDTYNSNNTHYHSVADITEIINDLQNYSEYFTDEPWVTLDEETNLKLKQINNGNKNTVQADISISQSNIIEEELICNAISQTIANGNCIYSQENHNTFKSPPQKNNKNKSCEENVITTLSEGKKNKNKSFEKFSSIQSPKIKENYNVNTSKGLQHSNNQQSLYFLQNEHQIHHMEQIENQNEERVENQSISMKEIHSENTSQAKFKDEVSHLLEDEVEFFEEIDLDMQISGAFQEESQQKKPNKRINQLDNSKEQSKCSTLMPRTSENQNNKKNHNKKDQLNSQNEIESDENVHCQSMASLEPLGDIHLELFSDESIAEENNVVKLKDDTVQDNQKEENKHLHINKNKQNQFEEITFQSKNKKMTGSQSKNKSDIVDINPKVQTKSKISDESYSELFGDASIIETSQNQIEMQSLNIINCTKQKHSIKDSPKKDKNINIVSNNDTNHQENTLSNYDYIISPPKSKRRKLSYGSRPKVTTAVYEESKSNSDIGVQSSLFQVSPRSSDFEIPEEESENSSALKKKRKWIPPFKSNSSTTTSTSSNPQRIQKKKKRMIPKFKPPRKLTKKEIELEFYKQDKKMLESDDSGQYIQQLLNRPSVKQIQAAKHIMAIHKTSSGIVVVPTEECKPKTRKKFITPLKCQPSNFDVTLLSDKNSDKYGEFINSKKKKDIVNVRHDMAHEYITSEVVTKNSNNSEVAISNKSSEESYFEKFGNAIQHFKSELLNKNEVPSTSSINNKELLEQSKGYYTQNKERIDNMVNKYLHPEMTSTDSFASINQDNSQQSSSLIFSQATMVNKN
ncbi:hypothetical protein ILUMI_24623 [Ignelater luminosus]|uniref:Uncharacterized protein n=1 Tax=Ignelater luminosus TaxID=2038154 RepID=A0A8K0FYK4_IGNLU|nr:hypothetical protein ILUMI_24623 [Ignelater luminosus]